MQLTIDQRLHRLRVRMEELTSWRVRLSVPLTSWTCDGEPLRAGETWPTRRRMVRLAHPAVQVPPDWPMDETRLHLDVGDEALLRIEYPSGRSESFGIDPRLHRELPLLERSLELTATAVARHEFGDNSRDPRLGESRLVRIDPTVERLERQLGLVLDAARSLEQHEVVPHLVAAAERALASLDWPSATKTYLGRMRSTPGLNRLWSLPELDGASDGGLDEAQRATVQASSERLSRELAALQERFPKQGSLAVSGHAHIDLAWLWPMDETRRKARRTFSTAVALLERNHHFRFNQSTAQLYAFLEEDDPELFGKVKEQIAAGRWEPVGGSWVESDTNMPTGESLVRQHVYGQRYFERHFGSRHRAAWLPDCFGFSPAMPQILRGAGLESFFTIKMNWSETNRFPYDLFWWEGLDGSRVLAHLFDNPTSTRGGGRYLGGYNGDVRPVNLVGTWRNFKDKTLHDESLLTVGAGDGGGGPLPEMIEDVREMEVFPVLPRIRFARVHDFFDRINEKVDAEQLPRWVGEMYLELHRGTLTTQGRTKRLHRQAERSLLAAEALGAMTAVFCGGQPTTLEPLWRVLLRNEFHDILPGSSIREVYELAEAELTEVVTKAGATAEQHLDRLVSRVAAGPMPGLVVTNVELSTRPLRLELTDPAPGAQQVDGGYLLAGRDEVPGLSMVTLHEVKPAGGLEVSERRLENELVRVELDEKGTLVSVFDKRVGREALDGRANQLWAYVDKPRMWEAWDIEADYEQQGQEITDLRSLEVVERGPHRAAIRIVRGFRDSTITQEIRLWSNSARIDFRTTLDWHDRRWLLKARFPLAVQADHATFECAFGVIRRPTLRNTTWEAAKFEVAGHRFADISEPGYGVALLNDGRYGHHASGGELGLSLLRSPVSPDPLADEGTQTVTYSLYPHPGDWLEGGVLAEAEDLNQPLRGRQAEVVGERTWTAVQVDGVPLALGAFKVAEDSEDLVLRLYEPRGGRGQAAIRLPEDWSVASEVNLLEEELGAPDLSFRPFQVRSWRLSKPGS